MQTDTSAANPSPGQEDDVTMWGDGGPVPTRVLTPLTGRDTEVHLLRDRWELAQEGMGQVVLIMGEAGLGKSRLVRTIRETVLGAAHPWTYGSPVIEWRCSDRFQNTGLYPITDHLQQALDFGHEPSPAARFERLAIYLDERGLGRPEIVSLFAKLLFLPPDERYAAAELSPMREREETFRAVREWLSACSQQQPVLFIVEDLHWADASTLEFLTQHATEGVHDRILTVLTTRPEFRAPLLTTANQTRIALNRLTRRQVANLLLGTAGGAMPASLVAQIYERTGGVPLLVEEFSRMAHDYSPEGELPTTLQDLVMGRLDRLASDRLVAQYGATLGREFHYEMLAAVTAMEEPVLQRELAKLERAEIVFRKGRPPNAQYVFKHALLEEAVLSALDVTRQQALHQRAAETIEEKFPLVRQTQPEVLAHHFTKAGLTEKAVGYWLEAGQHSQARCANLEAISHLSKGLELLRTLPESPARNGREVQLLGPLGTAYIAARGYAAPEVGPIFERARELSASLGKTPDAFTMRRGEFAYHVVRGNFRHCAELAAAAMQFAGETGDPGMLMEALFLEAITQFYRGDFVRAHSGFTRALAEYDNRARTALWATRTGENVGVTHRCYLALVLWHLGAPERGVAVNAEARELARTLDHPFSLEYALHHTGWLYQHLRLGAEAEAVGREQVQIASEQGFVFWHASGTLYLAAGILARGQLEAGLPLFQEGLSAYRATGANLGLPYYLSLLGEAFTKSRRFDDARAAFAEAFELADHNDERFQEAELHRLRGELYLAEAQDEAAAANCFQRAIEIARRQQSRAWELRATTSLARLRQRQRRMEEAFAALSSVFDAFGKGFEAPDLTEAAALLRELGNERMRDELAAGVAYVRGCIPPPMQGPVTIDWRYVPTSTLGGDSIGYRWVDEEHLALYLIDVTGHGLDSALLAVSISSVIRSGSLSGADLRHPDQVLAGLNDAFQGAQHGHRYYTVWYGVYQTTSRTLRYASGGHPMAVVIAPGDSPPLLFPATGSVMGVLRDAHFPAQTSSIPVGARLFIFSDGVYEIRREKRPVWDLASCIAHLAILSRQEENVMDTLLGHVRDLRGSPHLDDDFSMIEARLH